MGVGSAHDNWFSDCNLDDCRSSFNCNSQEFIGFDEWDPLKFCRALLSERGSAESTLVLIPLLVLFLLGFQIATAVHTRNIESASAQDEATTRAISGEFLEGDEFVHIDSSGDGQNLDLLVARHRRSVSDFLPGFLQESSKNRSVDIQGFAVIENQR